ncbi:MAG TPA: DUF3052 domain-containing protein [Devosia sp.]|nr:DUF3052 domain-containing protein [Devosia sp.]
MAPVPSSVGYSGTPLPQKLGLKDGQRVLFIDLPEDLESLRSSCDFAEVAAAGWSSLPAAMSYDLVHAFTSSRAIFEKAAGPLMETIARNGSIWISWPKKASKVATDITEDVIREIVLPIGLVDVKVAAVNDVWSGLKLVIRKELR